jgi:hypothetical protein
MTTTARTPRQQLNIAIQDTRVAHARVMANASVWSMDTDTPIDIDAFSLIIAMSEDARPGVPFNYWTRADVMETLFNAAVFCHNRRTFVPDDFAEQLRLYVTFLNETGWLDTRGEDVKALLGAFEIDGGHAVVRRPAGSPALV